MTEVTLSVENQIIYSYLRYIDIHKSMTQYIMYVLLEDSPIGVILMYLRFGDARCQWPGVPGWMDG